jgi:hypothetical protein
MSDDYIIQYAPGDITGSVGLDVESFTNQESYFITIHGKGGVPLIAIRKDGTIEGGFADVDEAMEVFASTIRAQLAKQTEK